MAGDDMLDAHEAGLALVAFRESCARPLLVTLLKRLQAIQLENQALQHAWPSLSC